MDAKGGKEMPIDGEEKEGKAEISKDVEAEDEGDEEGEGEPIKLSV